MRAIRPTCRYDNEKLIRAKTSSGGYLWAFVEVGSPVKEGRGFSGELFVCPKCGYSEFFDNDPSVTAGFAGE